jgi:hypothetical protein
MESNDLIDGSKKLQIIVSEPTIFDAIGFLDSQPAKTP